MSDLSELRKILEQIDTSRSEFEYKLTNLETLPNFHLNLQSIYLDLSSSLNSRWLSIIFFKNGVEKYWKSSKRNSISIEEKNQIKQRLFELIIEPNKQLAIQNAQAISRIARFDFPASWPDLLDQFESMLSGALAHDDNIKIHNLLLILNQVLKQLSMAKIGKIKPALQSKIPLILPLILKIYISYYDDWIQSLDFAIMEIGYLSLKIMKRIMIDILDQPNESIHVVEFFNKSLSHFQNLLTNYNKFNAPSDILEKYIKRYSKIYYLYTKSNPTNLITLPNSKEILYTLLKVLQEKAEEVYNNDDETENIWEFINIKTLLIFKSLINFIFKKGSVLTLKSKSSKQQITNAIDILTNEFFNEDLIKSITDLLINYYIKLRPIDLESWVNEPEEWVNEQVNGNYEYQIRQCAENFFQDLINNFKDLIVPYVLQKVENDIVKYNENSVSSILIKDSIFTIFQLSSNSIHDVINFNQLFQSIFLPEALKNDLLENKIIKRRVCLLINEWIGLNVISDENQNNTFSLLLSLLDSSIPINDQVVKLSAIQTLKAIISDWDFKKQQIKPYLNQFITKLLELIVQCQLTESKLSVLNIIADVIVRTNPLISIQELNQLLKIVPQFWDLSNNANELILKNSLLRILKNLIISLNENSKSTWEISLPLVEVSCSPKSEYYSLLSEDGYELWLTILQFQPNDGVLEPSLLQNLNDFYLYALLNQTEILPLILEIFRSYVLISPDLIIDDSAYSFILEIFKIWTNYLPNLRDDSLDVLLSILEIIIVSNYQSVDKYDKLLKVLVDSNLISTFISMILDDDQSSITISKLLLIVARLSFYQPLKFLEIVKIYKPNELNKFVDVWLVKLDENISNPRNRKIHILGLTSLLQLGIFEIYSNLKILIALWNNLLEEINEDDGDCQIYHSNYLYEFQYNDDLSLRENGEYKRFQKIYQTFDPVHTLNLKGFIKNSLNQLEVTIGSDGFKQLISSIDETALENLEFFLK